MTSRRPSSGTAHLLVSSLLGGTLALAGCKDGLVPAGEPAPAPAPAPAEVATIKQGAHVDPGDLNDAGDDAFIVRAAIALLGRPPQDEAERASYVNTLQRLPQRRGAVIDMMMSHPQYTERWSHFVMDKLRVSRLRNGEHTNEDCYDTSPWWDAVKAGTTGVLTDYVLKGLGEHVASNDAKTVFAPFTKSDGTKVEPNMRDLVRSAVLYDDLRGPYRANLFAQLETAMGGNEVTEANIRTDFWQNFEDSYLNRQHLCLGCHTTRFSVSGPAYDFDRHFPTPYRVEERAFGCGDGSCAEPPDLHADFRTIGVVRSGTFRPWGLSGDCGNFNPAPVAETCPTDPAQVGNKFDVCFAPVPGGPRRAPKAQFGATGPTIVPSVFRLNELLSSGITSFKSQPPVPSAPLLEIPAANMPGTSEPLAPGARAFALLTASTIAERVWEEVMGTRLTVPNHYPRTGAQRDLLHALAQGFMDPPDARRQWSLKHILRTILTHPHFNVDVRANEDFALDVVYDPWVLHDPRPDPSGIPMEERCGAPGVSFLGCINGLFQTNGCLNCHENPADTDAFGRWDHLDFSSITAIKFQDAAACNTFARSATCNAPDDIADECPNIAGKPAGPFAIRVNCQAGKPDYMPRGLPPLPPPDRDAIMRWVKAGITNAGTTPPPPPPATPGQEHNGIGDKVHWKSAFQLTWTSGTALGLDPWKTLVPSLFGYPSQDTAEAAGHYLDNTRPGGRGMSFLSFLKWEKDHSLQDQLCKAGNAGDRIKDLFDRALMASTPWRGDTLVGMLKQSLLGEAAMDDQEFSLVQLAAEFNLHQDITAANRVEMEKGVRRVCNVFIKSPLFLLSYVEPKAFVIPPRGEWPPGRGPDILNLSRWNRLWLPTYLFAPAGCTQQAWFAKPIEELVNAYPEPPTAGACPTTGWTLPRLCLNRLDCRPPAPLMTRSLTNCLSAGHGCQSGSEVSRVFNQVKDTLGDMRLPVIPPAHELEDGSFPPALDPSPMDDRFRSNLLVLPLAGGTVTTVSGSKVKSYRNGSWKWLSQGATIAHGETLFVPEGAKLAVQVGSIKYDTGPSGMERPLDLPGANKNTLRSHYNWETAWIVVANGPAALTHPSNARDPSIAMGAAHGPPGPVTMRGRRPLWAVLGAAGGWYNNPFPLPSDPKPAWATGVFYGVGAEVAHLGLDYRCRIGHTSQSTWAPPQVYNLWERINAGPEWTLQVIYKLGDVVTYNGQSYRALQGHQAQPGWHPPAAPTLWQAI